MILALVLVIHCLSLMDEITTRDCTSRITYESLLMWMELFSSFRLILIKTTMKILYTSPGKHMVLCKVACRRVGKLMVSGYENV